MVSEELVRRDNDDILLTIRVVPGANRDELIIDDSGIKVRVQAPPVDGKANKRVVSFLAKSFGVRPGAVVIERGETSRRKHIRIGSPGKLPKGLSGQAGGPD